MTIEIYALVHGKYHDCKRYVCCVFCDNIVFADNFDNNTWFTALVGCKGVMSGEVSHLHGKGNNEFEFIRDLR